MQFVKLILSCGKSYSYQNSSNIKMDILGIFLTDDVSDRPSSFREWFFDDNSFYASSNATSLSKENGYVLLSDLYSEENEPTELKMTYSQFLQILDDWEKKVIKQKPKEVIIKHENNEFYIETKD
jgi:hypothetical protein